MVVSAYEGKTGRNGNDQGKEHLAHFTKKWEENSVQVFKVYQNEDNLNIIVW